MAGVPRADARRSVDAILTAARDVLSEDSGAGLTVIAERADVHRATVYRHFPTREALIRSLHEAYLDDAGFAVLETNLEADDLLAEIEALIRRVYAVNLAWRAYAWAPPYSAETRARRSDLTDVTIALFGAAQREGLLRQDLSIPELLVTWGAPILFLAARVDDGASTLDEVVSYTLRLLTPE